MFKMISLIERAYERSKENVVDISKTAGISTTYYENP